MGNQMVANSSATQTFYVHIGKCGGESIANSLRQSDFQFTHIHAHARPPFQPSSKYILSVRDPILRAKSCFDWRLHLLANNKRPSPWGSIRRYRQKYELKVLKHYGNLNSLAEELGDRHTALEAEYALFSIGHMRKGHSWYLDALLENLGASQILAVINTESMMEDMAYYLDIKDTPHTKSDYHRNQYQLSEKAKINLRNALSHEYRTLQKLHTLLLQTNNPTLPDNLESFFQRLRLEHP
jgi:hypothetical protein